MIVNGIQKLLIVMRIQLINIAINPNVTSLRTTHKIENGREFFTADEITCLLLEGNVFDPLLHTVYSLVFVFMLLTFIVFHHSRLFLSMILFSTFTAVLCIFVSRFCDMLASLVLFRITSNYAIHCVF